MARPAFLSRIPATPPMVMVGIAILNVVAQIGIAVTGSVVRVTGSGLGCPTWPQCTAGSLVPVADPARDPLHQWIEFGNRLLGTAVVVVAVLCLLAALTVPARRRRLTVLAVLMPVGVLAQGVIGGITVLVGLSWWSVMPHFLASMVLVWLAVLLVGAAREHARGIAAVPGAQAVTQAGAGAQAGPVVPRAVRGLVAVSTGVLAVLLVAGTLVTAAGPHAGDAATPRLDVTVAVLAQLHADVLFAYLGLLVGLGFALHATSAPRPLLRRFRLLVVVVLAQGALGGVQYALGVPELLVSLHVLGAGLVTAAAAGVWVRTRAVSPPAEPPAREPVDPRASSAPPAGERALADTAAE